ncbi:hypothetical protein C7B77_20650 [Chamaesiphon polymorphus CCALA 037]|uniref:Uncharacterized protein n=1 Tax=Chamaesiphon polymorphus CCALA 037 TaxID=2107692 RepID=A0A2T1G4Z2_9CYAN|nr:hypothetical protein C7B77_20650 [Chamaesiphon polymorphus CCALA 037]
MGVGSWELGASSRVGSAHQLGFKVWIRSVWELLARSRWSTIDTRASDVFWWGQNPDLGVPTPRPPVEGRDAAPQTPLRM